MRAIAEAMSDQLAAGKNPKVEIMVPLVGSVMELHLVRDETERILTEVGAERGVTLTVPVGTMIELPRAALTAHRIADAADFFSFGTNDLTQTTGLLRDDVESTVFAAYLEKGGSPSPRSRPSTPTASGGWWRSRPRRAERPNPDPSSSGSAASTVAIRVHPLLPPHRAGLRVLLTVPAAGRPPRGRPRRGWAELPAAQRSRVAAAAAAASSSAGWVRRCARPGRAAPGVLRTSDPPGPMR